MCALSVHKGRPEELQQHLSQCVDAHFAKMEVRRIIVDYIGNLKKELVVGSVQSGKRANLCVCHFF